MTGSYTFWKWADNDLAGKPVEVHADLLRGGLHPAIQTFDARPLLKKLERAAAQGRKRDEEWSWEVTPSNAPEQAVFVFVSCPGIDSSVASARRFGRTFQSLGLSGIDEESGQIIPTLSPKLNGFITGHLPWENVYDITEDDLPYLIRRIEPREENPFGIIETNRSGSFVQCYAEGRRFVVEWANNDSAPGKTIWDHWRAQDRKRLAAMGGVNDERKMDTSETPDLIRYADTLPIFSALLRGESRPAKYPWRNINHIASSHE